MARDLESRTLVITGANTGIGRTAALALGARGARLVLACRSEEKTRPVLDELKALGARASFVSLDLGDLDSVRAAADRLLALDVPIDVLLNNAGVAGQRGFTASGFELAFGANHVGHFLLTALVLPKLYAAGSARVVNVSSRSHYRAKTIDFDAVRAPTRTVTGLPEYEVSKLANVLFTRELARRVAARGVHTYALHPGVVATDAWRRLPGPVAWIIKQFMISAEEGAATSLYCAVSPDVADATGRYYDACKERKPSKPALDDDLARELWSRSVEWTGADVPTA